MKAKNKYGALLSDNEYALLARDKTCLKEYLKSKGFDPDDMPATIKKEWRNYPICKAMLEYLKSKATWKAGAE